MYGFGQEKNHLSIQIQQKITTAHNILLLNLEFFEVSVFIFGSRLPVRLSYIALENSILYDFPPGSLPFNFQSTANKMDCICMIRLWIKQLPETARWCEVRYWLMSVRTSIILGVNGDDLPHLETPDNHSNFECWNDRTHCRPIDMYQYCPHTVIAILAA